MHSAKTVVLENIAYSIPEHKGIISLKSPKRRWTGSAKLPQEQKKFSLTSHENDFINPKNIVVHMHLEA